MRYQKVIFVVDNRCVIINTWTEDKALEVRMENKSVNHLVANNVRRRRFYLSALAYVTAARNAKKSPSNSVYRTHPAQFDWLVSLLDCIQWAKTGHRGGLNGDVKRPSDSYCVCHVRQNPLCMIDVFPLFDFSWRRRRFASSFPPTRSEVCEKNGIRPNLTSPVAVRD